MYWISLVPFLLILTFPTKSGKELFLLGWLAGVAAVGTYLRWFFDAVPLTWIGINSYWGSVWLAVFGWFLPVGYFAIAFGIFLVLARRVVRGTLFDTVSLALLWTLLEYLRTFLFSFHPLGYGEGTIVGDNMAFALLGYGLADNDALRQFSAIGGVYFLSFLVALPNMFIFVIIRDFFQHRLERRIRPVLFFSALLLLVFIALTFLGRLIGTRFYEPKSMVRIALVQAAFFPEEWVKPGYIARAEATYKRLMRETAALDPPADIIAVPESAVLFPQIPLTDEKSRHDKLGEFLSPVKRQILLTKWEHVPNALKPRNTTAVFDNQRGVIGLYEKQFLMPYGEYLPYAIQWMAKVIDGGAWLERNRQLRWYESGSGAGVFSSPFGKIGLLTCSEILSPNLNIKTVAAGAEILMYTASDAILRGSPVLHAQNIAMARINAAGTRRALSYVSSGERSFMLDPFGKIVLESPDLSERVITAELHTNDIITPAVRYRNWFLFFAFIVLAVWWKLPGQKNA